MFQLTTRPELEAFLVAGPDLKAAWPDPAVFMGRLDSRWLREWADELWAHWDWFKQGGAPCPTPDWRLRQVQRYAHLVGSGITVAAEVIGREKEAARKVMAVEGRVFGIVRRSDHG